jgi:hypothetical protein
MWLIASPSASSRTEYFGPNVVNHVCSVMQPLVEIPLATIAELAENAGDDGAIERRMRVCMGQLSLQ